MTVRTSHEPLSLSLAELLPETVAEVGRRAPARTSTGGPPKPKPAAIAPAHPAPRLFVATRPRPHPMTSPILVGGTAVKGERSESRSDAAGALDGRDEDQTVQLG